MIPGEDKELVLVLGGARSGKSSYALKYVEERFGTYLFLATARVEDDEMADRVEKHKESRGPQWKLLEESLEIPRALRSECLGYDAVLMDCLTVWLSNVLVEKDEEELNRYCTEFLEALDRRDQAIVIVSNEVGMGVVPAYPSGRRFRDLSGRIHQEIASLADKVYLMVAGLPLVLKSPQKTGNR